MQTNISATLESTKDGYSLDCEFPSFNESLFYDPVVGENLRSVGSGGEYNENESPDTTMPSSSPSEPPSSTPTLLDDDEDDDDEMDPQNSDSGGRGINVLFQQCWLSWRLP